MRIPFYDMPASASFTLGNQSIHTLEIVNFLRYVIDRDELEISRYLANIDQDSFFLVAATGLGKTVAIPLHVLIRLMQRIGAQPDPQPRVWIVEPRIPIAVDQMMFMNLLWEEYRRTTGKPRTMPLFGCVTSASGAVHNDAPIKFVTTGIFEQLSKGSALSILRDRIVIDEAHVTIEQNPGVELGIALARKAGVTVDYMSATVKATTIAEDLHTTVIRADQQRYPVWKANLWHTLEKALPGLVEATLVNPDASSDYFPQPGDYPHTSEVVNAVLEPGRSHGMLVTVNSFAGEQSDIARLGNILRKHFPDLPVLQLASEIVRDPTSEREFRESLKAIEANARNYVILATSVVEMGITFPSLDFVVTMDCGYEQETIGGVSFPVVAALGVNSLLQRIGRVGRRRPGIAYIANEVGADYAEMEDDELNGNALRYEPICFPLRSTSLLPLTYYAATEEWNDLREWLAALDLPSKLHQNEARIQHMNDQFDILLELGLVDNDNRLTPLGERMRQWIGRADVAYAVRLQQRFEEHCDLPELLFWLTATALSDTPPTTLRARSAYFVDYNGTHAAVPFRLDVWGADEPHEDLAVFRAIVCAALVSPLQLFGKSPSDELAPEGFYRWCNHAGLDSRSILRAGRAIAELWKLFCRINNKTARFAELFGSVKLPQLEGMPWIDCLRDLPTDDIHRSLAAMPGLLEIIVLAGTDATSFSWYSNTRLHSGLLPQDDTPVKLQLHSPKRYLARPVPNRMKKGDEIAWRPAHLGIYDRRS